MSANSEAAAEARHREVMAGLDEIRGLFVELAGHPPVPAGAATRVTGDAHDLQKVLVGITGRTGAATGLHLGVGEGLYRPDDVAQEDGRVTRPD